MQSFHSAFGIVAALILSLGVRAQTVQPAVVVPLDFNFNGIVHAGEDGNPNAPNGYRSISDRGLDFTTGIPGTSIFEGFQPVQDPLVLDMVHLGNRNTVDFGNRPFDFGADGDDFGTQPAWLSNPDQSGPQITALATPIPLAATSRLALLFQVSNGGGDFEVVVRTTGGSGGPGVITQTLSAPDWFGGVLPGRQGTDTATPGGNLSLTRGTVELGALAGSSITSIEFSNPSNSNGGYGILAATVETPRQPSRINQIALSYNFNGIVHAGEAGSPDDPAGFRSISDRALDFTAGIPNSAILEPYAIVDAPGALDLVHLGNRDTVNNGTQAFAPTADGDAVGTTPSWLLVVDQTVPQVTDLASPILIEAASTASVLFQVSNGGGAFDLVLAFESNNAAFFTLDGGDWFGGPFAGADSSDLGTPGANLNLVERTVSLAPFEGEVISRIAFANQSNLNAGYAILAMNVSGCLSCPGAAGGVDQLGGASGPFGPDLVTSGITNLGCDLEWEISGATPNTFTGFFGIALEAVGTGTPAPIGLIFPACAASGGVLQIPTGIFTGAVVDAAGSAQLSLQASADPQLCGLRVVAQYAEIVFATCPLVVSDAIGITIGN